ncbi:MAG: hypothetical protein GY766_05435, partial [Herbaspirillum sp.]|uniref:hypothetical protein n=1 Tax=Herbaspirillum sp. TaxID=1890675 RepID=UPI002589D05F
AVEDVSVGEQVSFQLVGTLREGTSRVSFTVGVPSTDAVMTIVGGTVYHYGANLVYGQLGEGDSAVLVDTNADGAMDVAEFDFGRVVNEGDNALSDADRIVVEVTAVVNDVGANTLGAQLVVNGSMNYTTGVYSESETVEVVGPVVEVRQTAGLASGDAGDFVPFVVELEHGVSSAGAAYDMVVAAPLNEYFELYAGSVRCSAVDCTIVSGNGGSDTGVSVSIGTYEPSVGVIEIAFDTRLSETVGYRTVNVSSVVDVTFDSSSGAGGRADAVSASSTVDIESTPSFSHVVSSTSLVETTSDEFDGGLIDLAIGETISLTMTTVLREGTSNVTMSVDASVTPGTLSIVSAYVASIGASITSGTLSAGDSVAASDEVGSDGITDTAVFVFGDVVNAGDNVTDAGDAIAVNVTCVVVDVAENVAGDTMSIGSVLDYAIGSLSVEETVEVVEAQLNVSKVASAVGKSVVRGDAADEILFTVTVAHTGASSGPAYNVDVTDVLSSFFELVTPGSVSTSHGSVTSGNGAGDETVRVVVPTYDLGESTLVITYTALLNETVGYEDANVTNTAALSYTSADVGGRSASVSDVAVVGVDSIPTFAMNISDSSNAETQQGAFDVAVEDVSVGEQVSFQLVGTLREGTSRVSFTVGVPSTDAVMTIVGGTVY